MYPLSAMYIEKHFDIQTKANIKEMIRAIRTETVKTFETAEWMNKTTQTDLLQKLDDLEYKYVGFLNKLMDLVKMKEYYNNFILPKNFFLSDLLFKTRYINSKDYIPEMYFVMDAPFTINALYRYGHNSISNNFGYSFIYIKKKNSLILIRFSSCLSSIFNVRLKPTSIPKLWSYWMGNWS